MIKLDKRFERILKEYIKVNEELEKLNRLKSSLKADIAKKLDELNVEEAETENYIITNKIVVKKSYIVPETMYKDLRVKKK